MSNALPRTNWDTDCRSISLDKRQAIVAARPGYAAQLYGVDGRLQGGLRPHYGFRKKRALGTAGSTTNASATTGNGTGYTFTAATKLLAYGGGSPNTPVAGQLIEITGGTPGGTGNLTKGIYYVASVSSNDLTLVRQICDDGGAASSVAWTRVVLGALDSVTKVYDLRHFTLQIQGTIPIHGFVVRAKGLVSSAVRYQTWIEWYDVVAAAWKRTILEQSSGTTAYGSMYAANSRLDIAVTGRLLYVFREGWEPILVTATSTASAVTMSVTYDTGPGTAPTLKRQGDSFAVGHHAESFLHEIRPGNYRDSSAADQTVSNYFSAKLSPSTLGTGAAAISGDGVGSAWFTSAFTAPDLVAGGKSSNADRLTFWNSMAVNVSDGATGLLAGNYSFAYQLYDPVTGRRSPLSQIVSEPRARFGVDTHNYFVWDIVYDSTKWTRAVLYRSVNSDTSGGVFTNSLLLAEADIALADYKPNSTSTSGGTGVGPDGTKGTIYNSATGASGTGGFTSSSTYTKADLPSGFKRAIFYNVFEDKNIVLNPLYNNDAYFDADMPTAGACGMYDGTLFCSRSRDGFTGQSGVGEIRYSSLTTAGPEQFPAANRYIPKVGTDSPWQFLPVGDRMIGLAPNRQYLVFKSGTYVILRDMHEGFGSVNPRAGCVAGNSLYVVTSSGLVTVGTDGAMDGIHALDYVFIEEWKDALATVQPVFDAKTKCLYVLRAPRRTPDYTASVYTDHGEMCCLWMTTSMTTQLIHTRFVKGTQGVEPNSTDDSYRAFFITDEGALYCPDEGRTKTASPSMLDAGSAALADLNVLVTIATAPSYSAPGMTLKVTKADGTTYPTLVSDMVNTVAAFTGGTLDGQAYKITAIDDSAHTITLETNSDLTASLATGDSVCINPMLVRVVAPPVGLQGETGQSFGDDLFRVRRMNAIGVHLVIPSTVAGNPNAKVRGLAYHGMGGTSLTLAKPVKNDGTEYTSIVEGPATNWAKIQRGGSLLAPGVEMYCAALDFVLLGFRAVGAVQGRSREGQST